MIDSGKTDVFALYLCGKLCSGCLGRQVGPALPLTCTGATASVPSEAIKAVVSCAQRQNRCQRRQTPSNQKEKKKSIC